VPRSQETASSLLANPGVVSRALLARAFASIAGLSWAGVAVDFPTSVTDGFAFEDLEDLLPDFFTEPSGAG
jgi:hypothetical protein